MSQSGKNHVETGNEREGERASAKRRHNRRKRRAMTRWIKRVVLAAIALGLMAALVVAFLPKPVPVDVASAARGTLTVTVNEDGKTRVKDRFVVSTPLAGNMPRLGRLPGDAVAEGEVIARVVPAAPPLLDARTRSEAQARLAAAQAARSQAAAQVERARVAHEQARRELERQGPLAARGAVAEAVAERTEYEARARAEELRSAELGVKVASQNVASARAALGLIQGRNPENQPHLDVPAPVSGQVLRVFRQDEGPVQAGAPIVELGDPASLEIAVDVLTRDAVLIHNGAPVDILRWGGDMTLAGHVVRVEPSAYTRISALGVEEQRVNVIIGIDDPRERWASLGDGYRVEVAIQVWQGHDVLAVPASAVFRRGDDWAVYSVHQGIARLTSVDIGRRNEREVQITSGLEHGDHVILHPSDRVTDGIEIVARGE